MRVRYGFLCVGLAAMTVTMTAQPAPAADPTPTPTATPASLPIGSVNARVTDPNSQPTGATHVEEPPIQ